MCNISKNYANHKGISHHTPFTIQQHVEEIHVLIVLWVDVTAMQQAFLYNTRAKLSP